LKNRFAVKRQKKLHTIIIPLIVCFLIGSVQSQTTVQQAKIAGIYHIEWHTNLKEAFELAITENKPLIIEFMANWCPSCKEMEDLTFKSLKVIKKASAFIPVRIDVDKQKSLAAEYKASARKYGGIGIPNFLFMTKDGKKVRHRIGYMNADLFISEMDSALIEIKITSKAEALFTPR
jgi:thiol:disulfide interchange protein